MGGYESYLEEALADSKMKDDFLSEFETINDLLSEFEDICMVYDEIMEQIKESPDEAKKIIVKIAGNLKEIEDFPFKWAITEITDYDASELYSWIEERYLEAEKFANKKRLPDYIEFGQQIIIADAFENIYTLSLDEIQISPSEGEEEFINILLSNNSNHEMYKGYIKLTVGYMNFDEDGGAADGVDDDVEYYYEEIIKGINDVIDSLEKLLDSHNKLRRLLEN